MENDQPAHTPYVLVVEDDVFFAGVIADALAPLALEVTYVRSAEEALSSALARMPDVVIADHILPGRSGLDLLLEMGNVKGHPTRILLTAAREFPERWGADIPVLQKPVKASVLQTLIQEATRDLTHHLADLS